MINFNLGEKQKQTILSFLNGDISITEFKQTISTWKSNANNAFAYLTNPIYYGLEYNENICKHFSEMEYNAFNNFYIFSRIHLYATQNLKETFKPSNELYNNYINSKQNYEGIEKVAVDFIEGKISFFEYEKEIKKFNNYKSFLSQYDSFSLREDEHKYNLNDFEVEYVEDVYGYHYCLYNAITKMGIHVFPTTNYINLSYLVESLTVNYSFEHEKLAENLKANIFRNLNFEGFSAEEKNFESIFNEKIEQIIEKYLPKRLLENNDYSLIENISWPINEAQNKLFDIIKILREDEKVSFHFKDSLSSEEKTITVIDESYVKEEDNQKNFSSALNNIKAYVLGKVNEFEYIMDYLYNSDISFSDFETDYYKMPFERRTMKRFYNCARHRLQLAEFCLKILKTANITVALSDVFMADYLKEREKVSQFKHFQDYVEGFISVEEFVSLVKYNEEFKKVHQSEDNSFYGNLYDKPHNERKLKEILQKTKFNVYDKYLLGYSAVIFIKLSNSEVYNNFSYYNEFKKIKKYSLNYVDDSIMYDYIEQFLAQKPQDIVKEKDIEKYVKDELKKLYSYEKSSPQWDLGAMWQYDKNNIPMHYLHAKVLTPYTLHKKFVFKNKTTGELVEVVQGGN